MFQSLLEFLYTNWYYDSLLFFNTCRWPIDWPYGNRNDKWCFFRARFAQHCIFEPWYCIFSVQIWNFNWMRIMDQNSEIQNLVCSNCFAENDEDAEEDIIGTREPAQVDEKSESVFVFRYQSPESSLVLVIETQMRSRIQRWAMFVTLDKRRSKFLDVFWDCDRAWPDLNFGCGLKIVTSIFQKLMSFLSSRSQNYN